MVTRGWRGEGEGGGRERSWEGKGAGVWGFTAIKPQ